MPRPTDQKIVFNAAFTGPFIADMSFVECVFKKDKFSPYVNLKQYTTVQ
jgi:hypothetical protein